MGQSTPVGFTQSPAIFELTDGLLNTSSLHHSDGSVTISGGGGGGALTFSASTENSLMPPGQTFCIAPPTVSVPDFSLPANLNAEHPAVCHSIGLVLPPVVGDDCSQWTVKIFTPIGEVIYANGTDGKSGGHVPLPGLPLGAHLY